MVTAVVAGIVLASCGAENTAGAPTETPSESTAATESTSAPSAGSPTASTPTGTQLPSDTSVSQVAVPEILQFTAPLVGGGTFDAAAVAGTPTVFWFWAPG